MISNPVVLQSAHQRMHLLPRVEPRQLAVHGVTRALELLVASRLQHDVAVKIVALQAASVLAVIMDVVCEKKMKASKRRIHA